jgi:hypothetical protein
VSGGASGGARGWAAGVVARGDGDNGDNGRGGGRRGPGSEGGVREVASTMGRRQAERVGMIGGAASREVAAPQVLVGEGQREESIPARGHAPGVGPP